MPKGKTLQPQLGGFETTTPDYLQLLKEAHEDVDKTIFSEAESVAKKLGLKFKRGPNKKNERIFEKADLCYNGDYSQITDLRRGSVICPTVADVIRAVDELFDTPGPRHRAAKGPTRHELQREGGVAWGTATFNSTSE
jgi:hypothetical protein